MKTRLLATASLPLLFSVNAHAICFVPAASTDPGTAGYSANAVISNFCSPAIASDGGSGSTHAIAGPVANMSSSAFLTSTAISVAAMGASSDTRRLESSGAIGDTLTFSGLAGGTATITAILHFSGMLGGNGYVDASIYTPTQSAYQGFDQSTMPGSLSFAFSVNNDVPVFLSSVLRGSAYGAGSFVNVRDYISLLLPRGASFTSASGVFGIAAVPEPSTWVLFGAGLAGMLLMGRARSKSPRSRTGRPGLAA